jgi:hypothetical protein
MSESETTLHFIIVPFRFDFRIRRSVQKVSKRATVNAIITTQQRQMKHRNIMLNHIMTTNQMPATMAIRHRQKYHGNCFSQQT